MAEVIDLLKSGSWIAFAAFGVYLAYKLAIATVITVGVVKAINKIVSVWSSTKETSQRVHGAISAVSTSGGSAALRGAQMSAASKHDAEQAAAEALRKHYGDESAMAGHVEAFHLRNALAESAYVDFYLQREKLRGYSDDANRAQEDRERVERRELPK